MHLVMIGASAAGLSALEKIRQLDRSCDITVVSPDAARPYSRVMIPYCLSQKVAPENIFIREPNYFETLGCTPLVDTATGIMPEARTLRLQSGASLKYDKLLVATGSSPVRPPIPGIDSPGVHHMWTLRDMERLAPLYAKSKKMAVLGSGFVALQAAWVGVQMGLEVTVIEIMPGIMPMMLDKHAAELLASKITMRGVKLLLDTQTRAIESDQAGGLTIHLMGREPVRADFMVVGAGVKPNTDFLTDSGLEMDRGILVNHRMETNLPGIYAAGDVAQGPGFFGHERVIHALWPSAVEMGAVAGGSMLGQNSDYKGSLNMNVTRMFDLTVASMGKFRDTDGDEVWYDGTLSRSNYFKIVMLDHTPIGGVSAGSPALVASLGILRPFIREKVQLKPSQGNPKSLWIKALADHHQAFCKKGALKEGRYAFHIHGHQKVCGLPQLRVCLRLGQCG